jgi:hypothetical protein
MKRTLLTACLLLLTMGLWAGGAAAYMFNDTTLVRWYNGHNPSSQGWSDVIGNPDVFDTFGADLSGGKLIIHTNWNPGKDGYISNLVKTADLFLYGTNLGNLAIRLDTLTGTGTVYYSPVAQTSEGIFASSGLFYGGRYDKNNPQPTPVWTTSSASTGSTSVVWTYGSSGLNNQVSIDLSSLGITSFGGFVWGTATCSNDGFAAPITDSLLLLGSGIISMMGMGIRRKSF